MTEERQDQYYEDEINLMEIFSVLWKRKWLILAIVAFSTIAAYTWSISDARSYTRALVQLNFSGIDKHVYPDGTQFEMHDIIAQDILDTAGEVLDNPEHREIFLSNPRGFISIDPYIPIEVQEKMKAMEREKKTYIYLPNQFYLQFIEQKGGVFSHEEKQKVLLAIAKAYENKFTKSYLDQKLLPLDLSPELLDRYDYLEMVDVIRSYLDMYSSFLDKMIRSAGLYRSTHSGLSFVDILNSIENIKKVDLNGIESILNISLGTRHKDVLVKKYQYQIKTVEKEMQKKEEEARVARTLLQDVWKQNNGSNLPQTGKENSSSPQLLLDSSVFDRLSEKEYISILLQRALDAEVAASTLKIDKKFLQEELASLSDADNEAQASGITDEIIENSFENIRKEIMELGEKANDLSSEYLRAKYSTIIKILKNPVSSVQYQRDPGKVTAMMVFLSLLFGIFIVFIVEFVSKSRNRSEPRS